MRARVCAGLALVVLWFATTLLAAYPRQIVFSGYVWSVKTSHGRVGPGPNYFSDSTQSVWVDSFGKLHMKIRKNKGKWHCSEVILNQNLGYGTYRFYLDSAVDNLDRNVVLGLFTWSDNPAQNHIELDIEMSRWGNANNQNAQYVVQPYDVPQNIHRFEWPAGSPLSMHSFRWQNGSVFCQSVKGHSLPPAPSDIVQEWTFTSGIPTPGDENARINLWLFRGRGPSNGSEVEVVFNRFEFVP
ncbi:hypothetical protein L0156_07115 [bacterium]|nr:hypothetical protein [bacterium]